LFALHSIAKSVYNFGFDILGFISRIIELLHISFLKVIGTIKKNCNKNNQTA